MTALIEPQSLFSREVFGEPFLGDVGAVKSIQTAEVFGSPYIAGGTGAVHLYAPLLGPIGGPYLNPPPQYEYGIEGDCEVGVFAGVPARSGRDRVARVNHVQTTDTPYPGPGPLFVHHGIAKLVGLPNRRGFFGASCFIPQATINLIPQSSVGYIELMASSYGDVDGDNDRPAVIRMFPDGRLGLAGFNVQTVYMSTFTVIPSTWFYVVLGLNYGSDSGPAPHTNVTQRLFIYNAVDALVETIEGALDPRGKAPYGRPGRKLLGGAKPVGLWPLQANTYHDDAWVSDVNLGPARIPSPLVGVGSAAQSPES